MVKSMQIAIDGPASAGKSTVAKIVARDLDYVYVDTGAMYRALTLAALTNQVDPADEVALVDLLGTLELTFKQGAGEQQIFLNGADITERVRQHDVTNAVSEVSSHKLVRAELVRRQQALAQTGGVVMDGRDIGTAVLPDAEVKIFLVASVRERAERRYRENLSKGIETDFEQLQQEIEARDYKDSTRKNSPLVQAADGIKLDTTGLSIAEVVAEIKKIILEKDVS